ncbi:MAG: HepT-like ribonuclease domain-containing protein [Bryobacteraceae bacterium]
MAVRHRIAHAYFDLDWQILWDAAIGDIPELRGQVLNILTREFSESEPD